MPIQRYVATAFAAMLCATSILGFAATRERPLTFEDSGFRPNDAIAAQSFAALDLAQVAREDADREVAGRPHRFAIAHPTHIDAQHAGSWETRGDRSVWRYRVNAQGASSLNFGFTHYDLPSSAKLFIYDAARRQVAGPYDASKNEPHHQLWTPVIAAHDLTIELDVATAERSRVGLLLGSVNQGYRGLGGTSKGYQQPDLGQPKLGKSECSPDQITSGTCNMDVACLAPSDPWNNPRRAVGAITLGGSADCTGSLVNNTANDRRMLFMTATHCELTASSSPTVVVYWNYEWPTCRTPGSSESGEANPPDPNMSNSGATFLAQTQSPFGGCTSTESSRCSDNTIVELDDPANPDFNLFWEGWDRRMTSATCTQSATDPTSTAGLCASIHHPNVDEKRITFVARDLESVGYAGGTTPANLPVSHWHAYWDPMPPILPGIIDPPSSVPPGVTEPGSSGSPLFSSQQRLVGVLSGGPSSCGATGEDLSDFYGQLAQAWEGDGTPQTRLKDYLDPLGSAPDFIDGIGASPFRVSAAPTSVAACATAGASAITVSLTADPGFAAAVALTASGQPPNSTATFAPPSVTPPGDSTLTIGDLAAATPGSYTVTITGTSGDDVSTASVSLALNDVAPGTVSLVSPADNATAVPTATVFSWTATAGGGPQSYLVEVASDAGFANVVYSATVTDATTVTAAPALATSTDYYWRVTAKNGCGDAAPSAVFHFHTLTAPGDCKAPTKPVNIFSDDIENGDNGWTADAGTGTATWAISEARANSPTHAWHAEDIDDISDQRLVSPSIALPSDQNPLTLQFQNWREIEASNDGCFDGGILEVSTDGATFTQIPDASIISGGRYDGVVSDQYDNPLAGASAWCTNTPRPYEDGPVRVDVTQYAGQNVRFRFRLGSDSSAGHEGWYVDDVNVSACSATGDKIFADGFDGTLPP